MPFPCPTTTVSIRPNCSCTGAVHYVMGIRSRGHWSFVPSFPQESWLAHVFFFLFVIVFGTKAAPAHEPHLRITPKENDARASSTSDKPNVFFIMVDDMGWNDIGYQSTDMANITPNLDRLAAGGVKVRGKEASEYSTICLKKNLNASRPSAEHLFPHRSCVVWLQH